MNWKWSFPRASGPEKKSGGENYNTMDPDFYSHILPIPQDPI